MLRGIEVELRLTVGVASKVGDGTGKRLDCPPKTFPAKALAFFENDRDLGYFAAACVLRTPGLGPAMTSGKYDNVWSRGEPGVVQGAESRVEVADHQDSVVEKGV